MPLSLSAGNPLFHFCYYAENPLFFFLLYAENPLFTTIKLYQPGKPLQSKNPIAAIAFICYTEKKE